MTTTTAPTSSYRRNVALLAIAQALFMCTQSMGIATTPLAGHSLLGVDKSLATLPIFLNHAGIMLTTIPASLLMGRIGRRAGFTIGACLAIVFGLLAAHAVMVRSFELLCVSALLQGSAAAFAWYYRFAAADASPDGFKPKAISYVMAGGIAAGFLGPQIAKWTVDWFAPVTFMGVYVAIAITGALSVVLMQFLRIPRLSASERAEGGRPLLEIVKQPAYIAAIVSSMFGYGVMTLVMSATPLAMLACGFHFADSATVIQVHIIAMFLPSFFTGHLIQKFGVLTIIATGALIQVGCALVNLSGVDFANFLVANALVGLGWNFTYVGGSTLLTRTYRPAERARVQASHDFTVYATTATAAALAGFLQQKSGWMAINLAALPLMVIVMLTALWFAFRERREARTQPAE
ncbi:MAG: MFS transporter [Hyphomicrobiaceae bacterium]